MRNKKFWITIGIMCLALTGCGNNAATNTAQPDAASQTQENAEAANPWRECTLGFAASYSHCCMLYRIYRFFMHGHPVSISLFFQKCFY